MNLTGLTIALGSAALVGFIFGVNADLDLQFARPFFDIVRNSDHFGLRFSPVIVWLHDFGLRLVKILFAAAVSMLAINVVMPRARRMISSRAMIFLIVTFALGPGVLANVILKEHWGRSRPIDVVQFDGNEKFVAWWDPHGDCRHNCSFVSGDAAAAFWTLAPAALVPPAWRPLAYAGAVVFGAAMSLARMAVGAHFITDVVFAGVFMFLTIWVVHGAIYLWPRSPD